MTAFGTERTASATQPEEDFIAQFARVFGFEKTQLLAPKHPVADRDNRIPTEM